MALASVEDVVARLGKPLDDEGLELLVETRLGDAERILIKRIPDLLDRATDDPDGFAKDVIRVEAEMVLRLVRNPDGYSQESDGNYSYAIYQQVASGKLEVFPDEWDLLGVAAGGMMEIMPTLPTPWTSENQPLIPFVPYGQCGDWT